MMFMKVKNHQIDSPAYKNGSILTSIKIGNSFLTLQAVIQSVSVVRRLLARFCGLLSLSDDILLILRCCCCKFSLSFSTCESFGQLWCSKILFFWKLRVLNAVTSSLSFHRCFCDLFSSILNRFRHFSLMRVDEFCVLHFLIDLFSI